MGSEDVDELAWLVGLAEEAVAPGGAHAVLLGKNGRREGDDDGPFPSGVRGQFLGEGEPVSVG